MNKRARQLLQRCQGIHVVMVRLKPEEIDMWTRPKPKPKHPPHLLQPWLQRSIANLPASCTISLAPVDSQKTFLRNQQAASPSSTIRQVSRNHISGKSQARAPPGLLPLITGTWSMQPVKPKPTKNQFILPDLIPVINRHSKTRSVDPVIIQMPSVSSPRSVAASPRTQMTSSGSITDIVDLCSSEDEVDDGDQRQGSKDVLSNSLVLPPGISITKIKKTSSGAQCHLPNSRPNETVSEKNNNRSRSVAQWLASAATAPLPVLTFMGQHQQAIKKDLARSGALDVCSADSSLPIVTPLKLAKLPAEKREQMKQSLLKIQKKEKKSPTSNSDSSSPPTQIKTIQTTSDVTDPLQLSPLPRSSVSPKKEFSPPLSDECEELKHKGLSGLLFSNQRNTRRKREKEPDFHSSDEEDSLSDGPSKKARLLDQSSSSNCLAPQAKLIRGSENYSSVIEVDVGGPDNDMFSRASSFGSLTPESRLPRKRQELFRLLNDECKELRRKGLEDLSFEANSNHRVTRCRTKSQPLMSGKR